MKDFIINSLVGLGLRKEDEEHTLGFVTGWAGGMLFGAVLFIVTIACLIWSK